MTTIPAGKKMVMKLNNIFYIFNIILLFILITGCPIFNNDGPEAESIIGTGIGRVVPDTIPYGCDLSWVTQMENSGYYWKNSKNAAQDIFLICKNLGFNACRFRVWVNPAGGWNGQADTVAKSLRAAALGMKLMIDFHLSDSWADPGQQTPPAAWAGYDVNAMKSAISSHVTTVLTALKTALDGAGYASADYVKWIQIGNETNSGMLWTKTPASGHNWDDSATTKYGNHPENYAAYFKAGYDAAKAVFPSALTGPHLASIWDTGNWTWNIGQLNSNGASWDICFGSLYPVWSNYPDLSDFPTLLNQVKTTISTMNSTYSKPCIITEFGVNYASGKKGFNAITQALALTQTAAPAAVGLFYWEPEGYNWQGYNLGAWDPATRRPTLILTGN